MEKSYFINNRGEDIKVTYTQFFNRAYDIISYGKKIHEYFIDDQSICVLFYSGEHYIYTITDFSENLSKVL